MPTARTPPSGIPGSEVGRATWNRADRTRPADQPDDDLADDLEAVAQASARRGARIEAFAALNRAAQLTGDALRRVARLALAAESAREGGLTAQAAGVLRQGFVLATRPDSVRQLMVTEWRLAFSLGANSGRSAEDMVRLAAAMGPEAVPDQVRALLAAATRCWLFDSSEVTRSRIREGLPREPQPSEVTEILRQAALALADPPSAGRSLGAAVRILPAAGLPEMLPACAVAAESAQDLAAAAACGDTAAQLYPRIGTATDETLALAGQAGSVLARGRLDEALELALRSGSMARDLGLDVLAGLASATAAEVWAWLGDTEQTRAAVRQSDTSAQGTSCLPGEARAAWAEGLLALGENRFGEALKALRAVDRHPTIGLWAVADLAEATVAAGDVAGVGHRVAHAVRVAAALDSESLRTLAWRAQAILSPDRSAEAWFVGALIAGASSGTPLELARGRLSYGEWLRRQGRRDAAEPFLRAAERTFVAVGAVRWAQRATRVV